MSKVFEDVFMDFQSGLISLCLEVTGGKISKIYAYCSNEKKSKMFNAFFDVNGEIKTLNQLDIPKDLRSEFLRIGTHDLVKLDEICERFKKPVPREIKMNYDVATGKFDAKYRYEEVCSTESNIDSTQVFLNWISEIRGKKYFDERH